MLQGGCFGPRIMCLAEVLYDALFPFVHCFCDRYPNRLIRKKFVKKLHVMGVPCLNKLVRNLAR